MNNIDNLTALDQTNASAQRRLVSPQGQPRARRRLSKSLQRRRDLALGFDAIPNPWLTAACVSADFFNTHVDVNAPQGHGSLAEPLFQAMEPSSRCHKCRSRSRLLEQLDLSMLRFEIDGHSGLKIRRFLNKWHADSSVARCTMADPTPAINIWDAEVWRTHGQPLLEYGQIPAFSIARMPRYIPCFSRACSALPKKKPPKGGFLFGHPQGMAQAQELLAHSCAGCSHSGAGCVGGGSSSAVCSTSSGRSSVAHCGSSSSASFRSSANSSRSSVSSAVCSSSSSVSSRSGRISSRRSSFCSWCWSGFFGLAATNDSNGSKQSQQERFIHFQIPYESNSF